MRLIENSNTKSIYNFLSEDNVYGIETREEAAKRAAEEMFDAMTDDIFLGNVDFKEDKTGGTITLSVYAYGGEPDEDGDIEMQRDVELFIPYDYPDSEPKELEVGEFYEMASEAIKNWIEEHNSPDNFYEGVTVNSGSTTVISDESGVTVEDNGTVITAEPGANVNITASVEAPAEMDIAEPVAEEPVEELPAEELPEESVEAEETEEDLDESTVNEEVLEKKDEETEEELNNSKVEECDKKVEECDKSDKEDEKIEEADSADLRDRDDILIMYNPSLKKEKVFKKKDGKWIDEEGKDFGDKSIDDLRSSFNSDWKRIMSADEKIEEAEQTVEIYQNPEFDYKITDITELQNTDAGDVRAIDMSDILVGLDEAFTLRYNDPNAVVINSFLTKHGKDYSSAIVDVTTPTYSHYSLIFESAFDGKMYESTVRDACDGKKIEHLCVKSYDAIKPFEDAILETINLSYKLTEHRSLVEDAQLINVDAEANEDKYDTVKDPRIDQNIETNEKAAKDNKKFYKTSKKFDVEEEPDQKNTQGEEIAPLTLKEEDESTEEPLQEETLDRAIFHRKPASVSAMIAEEENGITVNTSTYTIINTKELSESEFDDFANNLCSKSYDWLKELYTDATESNTNFRCIEVLGGKDYSILVDPNGYDYARYAAIKGNVGTNEEEIAEEPIEEPIIDEPVEEVA